ncbi:MAG: Photosystem I assembly protein Ycf3 [Chlamydiae bacterium]|nr:Photosystem I assembly protein Ycf3 [Chlamydiota bacterium]
MNSNTSTLSNPATLPPAFLEHGEEHSQLADELVFQGEYHLLHGNLEEALEAFKEADSIIEVLDPSLYYREGLSLFEFGSEEGQERVLLLASKKFKKAHQLEPNSIDILQAWGNTLTLLGETLEEHHFFVDAKEKYEKALPLAEPSATLLWDYGNVWYHIGVHSEEAVDLQKAIQYFEKVIEQEVTPSADLWIDLGATALLLSTKLNDGAQIVKAVNAFKRAVSEEEDSFECWNHLAISLDALYAFTHDEDHFIQANECFEKASKLAPQEAEHWTQWARFLCDGAKLTNDPKRLRDCLEKCHHAYACDPENPQTLTTWGEALAMLGKATERLDLIYEAENKVTEAIQLCEEHPDAWYSLGVCFSALGSYFHDQDHFYQAIEKFQIGLSIDRTYDHIWHEIAKTYVEIGTLEGEIFPIMQSIKFFKKALLLAPSSTRHVDYAMALAKLGEMSHEKPYLDEAIDHFEVALSLQRNAMYLHPDWYFSYASTLDLLGDFYEEEKYYTRAIEIFSHVLMVDPDFPQIHHRLAQAFCHLGELMGEVDSFYRAIHHLRFALKRDEDNDHIILDWGIAMVNISQHTIVSTDVEPLMLEAEQKMTKAAKLGNLHAYYYLSCLNSLMKKNDHAMHFLIKAEHYNALPPLEELLSDEWLEDLRSTSEFFSFLAEHPNLS